MSRVFNIIEGGVTRVFGLETVLFYKTLLIFYIAYCLTWRKLNVLKRDRA
jgi:hypothetical protein